MGQPSPSPAQPSGRNHLTRCLCQACGPMLCCSFISSSIPSAFTCRRLSNSHPSGHPPPHALPIVVGQQPTVKSVQQCKCESSAPFGYGQSYVCGPMINQTYRRVVFEVGASLVESKSTDLPMYLKNKVTLLPNVPLNYISNSIAFRARFLTTIMRRIVGNQSSYVSIARNNGTPRISVRNSTVGPQETDPPILGAIAQSSMLGFRLVDTPIEFICKLGNSNDQVPVD
ncbi:hypothetical protein E5676_scaffold45G001180 [Cucumis melo var. makuwa]|uniref:Uncharacterized protein n=1 Tax=Cucumis melo var. makuwa TaxID=1194695 RepID=A0A5D3CT12_CUCMM|nr:hypothetical protein E6C27_scaffold131G001300 [Cucumis melo var. makuwa]TYK15067.1 hypothetical protein E5676_scaffold45G001180 [Cucumis melo var. makuwa]